MGRLIDADLLLSLMDKRFKEKKDIVPNNLAEGFMQMEKLIKEQPTAYDVEAKIAELNETGRKLCDNVSCSKECENCEHGVLMRTIIEIVRGKERKYCGNCKHQPEPLTTCEWLKSQTQIIKECPRWEGKE